MSRFSQARAVAEIYGTDTQLEEQGAWFPIPSVDGTGTVRLQVRSHNARGPKALRREQQERYHDQFFSRGLKVPPSVADADGVEMAVRLVAAWEGFVEADGTTPIPCTEETVRELMTEYPHLLADVLAFATRLSNYRGQRAAAIVGNSPPFSAVA